MTPDPRYPVYVISKGRSKNCLTAKFLIRDRVPFKLVIEPQEAKAYSEFKKHLLILPFKNLGKGSIPARNWVWEHAKKRKAKRHWILDDNIRHIFRRWKTRKIICEAGVALRVAEDFTDRYTNVGICGFNYGMFSPNRKPAPPFVLNVHVYSSLLIDNSLPYRWRGRYNEDTDLCLQVLTGGLCTILLNAFLIAKMPTMLMKGGNTTELYKADGRLKMAKSLERMWPGIVETKRRYGRPQHVIKKAWGGFDTPLKKKKGVSVPRGTNEYGMKIVQHKRSKNKEIQRLIREDGNG